MTDPTLLNRSKHTRTFIPTHTFTNPDTWLNDNTVHHTCTHRPVLLHAGMQSNPFPSRSGTYYRVIVSQMPCHSLKAACMLLSLWAGNRLVQSYGEWAGSSDLAAKTSNWNPWNVFWHWDGLHLQISHFMMENGWQPVMKLHLDTKQWEKWKRGYMLLCSFSIPVRCESRMKG